MLNAAGIHGTLRNYLWAEATNYENDTNNVLIKRRNGSSPHEKNYGKQPGYQNNLQQFSEIGIIKLGEKIVGKLTNKGDVCMMLGYATDSAPGTY